MKNKYLLIFLFGFLLFCSSLYSPLIQYFKIPIMPGLLPLTGSPFTQSQYFSTHSVSISHEATIVPFDEKIFLRNYFPFFLSRIYFNFFDRHYQFSQRTLRIVSLQFCKELRKSSNLYKKSLVITLKSRRSNGDAVWRFVCA